MTRALLLGREPPLNLGYEYVTEAPFEAVVIGSLSLSELLQFRSQPVLEALRQENLTERHGRALLKLPDESLKLTAIREISRQSMSVAQTEKYIASLLRGKPEAAARANVGGFLNSLPQSLSRIQRNGIPAVSERRETDSQIVLTITIPKEKAPSSPE